MLDKIILKRMLIQAVIGVNLNERDAPQDLFITLTLYTDFSKSGRTDDIEDTTNYSWVTSEVVSFVQNLRAKTLEFLAVQLCERLLSLLPESISKYGYPPNQHQHGHDHHGHQLNQHGHQQRQDQGHQHQDQQHRLQNFFELSGTDFCGAALFSGHSKSTKPETPAKDLCYIALGSNLGNRASNIERALELIRERVGNIRRISFLYETPPVYLTDQPSFLNCAIAVDLAYSPKSDPLSILDCLKTIETEMGRLPGVRYGPRIIDLDIIFLSNIIFEDHEKLIIPHNLMHERAFVLGPLLDIVPADFVHPKLHQTISQLVEHLPLKDLLELKRVIPIKTERQVERFIDVGMTNILAILNMTPDSFSDGGKYDNVDKALQFASYAFKMDSRIILDVGGESTRPNSQPVSAQEEISRVMPVLHKIASELPEQIISLDTNKFDVAKECLGLYHILNDVYSVSRFYSDRDEHEKMCKLVAQSGKPWIIMHCRGTSTNMTSLSNYTEGKVLEQCCHEMLPVIKSAIENGVLPWNIIVDPGIGFSKALKENLEILRDLKHMPQLLGMSRMGGFPVLVGASRKKFISTLLSQQIPYPQSNKEDGSNKSDEWVPEKRTNGSLAIAAVAVKEGASFLRVHDVTETLELVTICCSIWKQ